MIELPSNPITIVIPVYNRAELLPRTLDSVAAQTFRPLRLIVVDNNSTDNSLAVARAWADEHHSDNLLVEVVSEQRPGAAAARNRGLSMVESEWTMFFDSDDLMSPGHVALAMSTAGHTPAAELIGWDVAYHRLDGKVVTKPFEPDEIDYHNLMHASLATQRYCARTDLFRRAGCWNPDVSLWDDIELGARLLRLKPVIVKRSGPITVDVFHNAESITTDSYGRVLESCLNTLRLMRSTYPVSSHLALKEAILLGDCRSEGYRHAHTYFKDQIKQLSSWRDRLGCRLAYYGRRLHVRGLARILKPLMTTQQ